MQSKNEYRVRRILQDLRSKAIICESEVKSPSIFPFSDAVTREQLQDVCGTSDLHSVRYLEITLDLKRTSINQVLDYLPSLRQLVLTTDGPMTSVRDLGVNVKNLTMVSVSNCGLKDLDGISSLASIVDLRLSYNNIDDLTPLALHDTLEILDLSHNLLGEIVSCEILGTCRRLVSLDLRDNPVSHKNNCLRRIIRNWIPQVSEVIQAMMHRKLKH
jgi:Leucine-rich repeat (LRR) protein